MKWQILGISVLLAGCQTVVVSPQWPAAPAVGTCPNLDSAAASEQLSDLLNTVVLNYEKYHNCRATAEAWEQWYNTQKQIHETEK